MAAIEGQADGLDQDRVGDVGEKIIRHIIGPYGCARSVQSREPPWKGDYILPLLAIFIKNSLNNKIGRMIPSPPC